MGARREQRLRLFLPVTICGMDANGETFQIEAETYDITAAGVRLHKIPHAPRTGSRLTLTYHGQFAEFAVAWVGDRGTNREGHVGLVQLSDKNIWGRELPRLWGDTYGDNNRWTLKAFMNLRQPQPERNK